MKPIIIVIFSTLLHFSYGQPNCYIYPENSGERKACELSHKSSELQQGSKKKQEFFDSIIAIGPNYAWAYYQKSVPYLKRGFLHEGLQILNKAITLDPTEFLCYRAYWFWQYKNYKLCIEDLETYYKLPKAYIQFTPGGEKDMKVILGLSYAKRGDYNNGIRVLSEYINSIDSESNIGLTDYHALGLLYTLDKQYNKAIITLNKQLSINEDLADTYYFLGIAFRGKSNLIEAKKQFNLALQKFEEPNRLRNINGGFPVSISDIKREITTLSTNN